MTETTQEVVVEMQLPTEVATEIQAFLDLLASPEPEAPVKKKEESPKRRNFCKEIENMDCWCDDAPCQECEADKAESKALVSEIKEEGIRELLAGLVPDADLANARSIDDFKIALIHFIGGEIQANTSRTYDVAFAKGKGSRDNLIKVLTAQATGILNTIENNQ